MLNAIKLASFLSAGGAYLSLALIVIFRSRLHSRFSAQLALACLATAVWAVGMIFVPLSDPRAVLLPSADAFFNLAIFEQIRLLAWIFFLFQILHAELPRKNRGFRPGTLWALVLGGGMVNLLCWHLLGTEFGITNARLMVQLAVGAQLMQVVLAVLILENLLRNGDSEWVWSIKHLCLGLGLLLAFDFFLLSETLLLNRIDPNLFVARGFVNLLALPMVLISASRAKSWNIDVKVSRQMAFHTASLMATGLYLSAMALTGYLLQQIEGAWSNVLQIVFLAGAFLILVIVIASGSARANIRVWIAKNFFTYRFDYREVWLRVTDAISTPGPLGLHERIVRAIAELVECTAGALWVHVPEDKAFLPTARWHFGDPETEPLSALGAQDAFVRYLAESGWVVDLRETKPATSDTEVVAPPDWLATHRKARFVVPFFHGDALRAILVIGAPRIRDTMDWEERDLLKTAGRQAASYLAEEAAADALSDARRLEDFHKRSAFIVHDIKNSIGQLELLIANAERYKDRPEFQEDMLLTVDNTVSQMKKLLQTFKQDRAEAAAGTPEPAPCAKDSVAQAVIPNAEPVAAVVRRSVRNWLPKKNDLEIEIDPHPDMEVDGEKMESVLNHLIHNAVEATAAGGTVALRLAEENGRILLEVRDTGPGMDKDFIEKKLFKPLDSGHENGFGLGAYQTREMVRDMGGRLEVDSAPGRGTIMRITLSPAIMPGSSNPTPKANQ